MKQTTPNLSKPYSKGSYNKFDIKEQWIRITEGCPNACLFCRESIENGREPIYYPIPEIVRNDVKIMDMNLIAKPRALEIIKELGSKKVKNQVVYYELVCGVDYRFTTQQIADALHQARFKNIRISWDHSFGIQKEFKEVIEMFKKAGYRSNDIMVFMICNWLRSYDDNLRKLDLCKVWNVKVGDCYFDNQLSPDIKPIHWTTEQIKDFRKRVRKHNQLVNFKIDPEYKVTFIDDINWELVLRYVYKEDAIYDLKRMRKEGTAETIDFVRHKDTPRIDTLKEVFEARKNLSAVDLQIWVDELKEHEEKIKEVEKK